MGGKQDWSEVKRILAQASFPIALALLFGSHARGEALEESDPEWEARRGGSAWWGRPPGKGWSFSRP